MTRKNSRMIVAIKFSKPLLIIRNYRNSQQSLVKEESSPTPFNNSMRNAPLFIRRITKTLRRPLRATFSLKEAWKLTYVQLSNALMLQKKRRQIDTRPTLIAPSLKDKARVIRLKNLTGTVLVLALLLIDVNYLTRI